MELNLMNSLTNPFTTRIVASSLAWGVGAGAALYTGLRIEAGRSLPPEKEMMLQFSSLLAVGFGIGNLALEAFSKFPIFPAVAGAYLTGATGSMLVGTACDPSLGGYFLGNAKKMTISFVKDSIALGALAMIANRMLKKPENFWNVTGFGTKGLLVAARVLWPFISNINTTK